MFQFNIEPIINKLCLPTSFHTLIKQPWSFISYMFLHNGFLHLLFNMIWLHVGGKLFLQYLNPKQLLSTYILGGLFGGITLIIAYNYIPVFKPLANEAIAIGASASVFAIMVAIATYAPNYALKFPLIGFLKLKYIAIFMVFIDILSIPKGNAGGHIAHLGGAMFGYIYIKKLQKGKDLSIDFFYIFKIIKIHSKQKNSLKKYIKDPSLIMNLTQKNQKIKNKLMKF